MTKTSETPLNDAKLKYHKQRKTKRWCDIEVICRRVWDDLDNIEKEITELLELKCRRSF